MGDNNEIVVNGFVELWVELKRRFFAPVRHVTFWTYLLVGVIFFGGLAIWLELCLYVAAPIEDGLRGATSDHLKVALVTFFPALIGSVSTQLLFEEAGRNKRMLAFAVMVGVFFLAIGLWLTLDRGLRNSISISVATVSCCASVLVWWVANGSNRAFQDEFDVDAPLGGAATQQPAGDLQDFKV